MQGTGREGIAGTGVAGGGGKASEEGGETGRRETGRRKLEFQCTNHCARETIRLYALL